MRLFVAVDLDDQTRAQLAAARDAIRDAIEQAPVPPRVTWVKDEAAHVTVRFIGEVADAAAPAVQAAVARGFGIPPFDVRWQSLGTFPGGRRPRVLWLGPGGAEAIDAMRRLAREVNERLEPLVGPAESRPFTPHVTIGRVKDPGRGVAWAQAMARVVWTPTTTYVDHVTLYVSRLSPKGPTYTALRRAPLSAAA